MALDLAGIGNVGEFYSQHYLDSLFAGDVKNVLKRWASDEKEGGAKAPAKRLAGLANRFFSAAARAAGNADAEARLEPASDFHAYLLDALGYERAPSAASLDDGSVLPLLLERRVGAEPYLWVMEAPFASSEDEAEPLDESPLRSQLPAQLRDDSSLTLAEGSYRELFDGLLFRGQHPPRWVLLLAGGDAFLIDRHKWPQGKYLHFSLGALFGVRDAKALAATAALLHADVLLPEQGQSLLDRLDEQSHKHAYAVSTDLKQGAQRAIELLANEAVYYLREVSREGVFKREGLADELTHECIVYLYRLLFLFYVEARSRETAVVPMGSEDYRRGYSLESLRDLELVPLTSVSAREGSYLDKSLRRLFRIVQHGYPRGYQAILRAGDDAPTDQMTIAPLRSALFDDEKTPILRRVTLRNHVLQEVLQQLSLSKAGERRERGRISYAQLGINQLGAVYEGLLSYRGFFATEDLYEVARASDVGKPDAQTYFVPEAHVGEYSDGEVLKDAFGRRILHPKGSYLFRLAGRDREKSASYYTPQVLTECLVKYTLKERLGESFGVADERPAEARLPELSADELLELTICEPAMGSGAFLNEAIDQLAHRYLEKKQSELGRVIAAEQYPEEHARVKYHFAVNRCYGVDLNPLAAELGKVSLWLNVLHQGAIAPFLDLRIRVGNSLVGARREVFESADLLRKRRADSPNWLGKVPRRVPLQAQGNTQTRPRRSVYHFLLPDLGMAAFEKDKVVKAMEREAVQRLKLWRKEFCREFSEIEVHRLEVVSERVDRLWEAHLAQRREVLERVRPPIRVWPEEAAAGSTGPRDALTAEEEARALTAANKEKGGQRLKRVMDYWCALWFWPLSQVDALPSREEWLSDLEALTDPGGTRGEPDARRMACVADLAERQRFFHWELSFAEVFADRGGMDIIVGNPPWLKVEWKEAGVLSDYEPALAVKKLSAKQAADRRAVVLEEESARAGYMAEFETMTALPAYLNARQNYPLLKGVQTNLYKCFMTRSWQLGSQHGVAALFHQNGVFDDPKGGLFRSQLLPRLALACRFQNELMLFRDILHTKSYAFTVCRATPQAEVSALSVANLFHPTTLDASFMHEGQGPIPGLKTADNKWLLSGHRSRIGLVNHEAVKLFVALYDEPGTPALEARLPVVHSREILNVLRRFAEAPRRLADLGDNYFATEHFHETNQQKDGTIRRETRFPRDASEWVVSGPHFYVGTPFNKTPNEGCRNPLDYSAIDLTMIPEDYLPRTNYVPACEPAEYKKRTPHWRGKPVTDYYRYVNRTMVAPTGERTLTPSIIPPGPSHIDLVFSITFDDTSEMLNLATGACSIPFDFYLKSTGKGHARADILAQFPAPVASAYALARILRLNSLSHLYTGLWRGKYKEIWRTFRSANQDPRAGSYAHLTSEWTWDTPFRTPYARRQALVELDALAALSLGMTLDELLLIYTVQFPTLQKHERGTYYDRRGKIVFTNNSHGLPAIGMNTKEWKEIKTAQQSDTLPEWAHDQQGPYEPPFDKCDRSEDMAQAYEFFQSQS